jgi:hypothetical protein
MNCLRPLEHWNRGFESHSRHECLCALFCVCVVLCVGSGLATGWAPVKGVVPTVYRLRNWKSGQSGCRIIEREKKIALIGYLAFIFIHINSSLSLGFAVGIATAYGLDDRGVEVWVPVGSDFLFSISSRPALGPTQPSIQWVRGALSPEVKRQVRTSLP